MQSVGNQLSTNKKHAAIILYSRAFHIKKPGAAIVWYQVSDCGLDLFLTFARSFFFFTNNNLCYRSSLKPIQYV